MGIEKEVQAKVKENTFDKIIVEKFPYLRKDGHLGTEGLQNTKQTRPGKANKQNKKTQTSLWYTKFQILRIQKIKY
jgi:hypothetical protein